MSVLGLGVVFWAVGWLSTLITVVLMGLAVPLYQRAGRRSETLAEDYQQRRSLLEARQLELLNHAPELRALGAVAYGAEEIAAISNSEHAIAMRAIRVALESSLITEFLSGVSIGLVAMVVGFGLLEGHLSLEHALIAILVTSEIFVNVRRFGVEFHRRENAQKSLALLSVPASLPASANETLLRAEHLVTEAGSTSYDFTVTRGDRVLITGPSGAGKTTLLHTLLGWRASTSGRASHGDVVIGYVSVESALVAGTLYDNLSLGRDVDSERIKTLLQALDLTGPRFSTSPCPCSRTVGDLVLVRRYVSRSLVAYWRNLHSSCSTTSLASSTCTPVGLFARFSTHSTTLAVVEATVDTPLLDHAHQRFEVPG